MAYQVTYILIKQHYLSLSTWLWAYLCQLFRPWPVTLTVRRQIQDTSHRGKVCAGWWEKSLFCCLCAGSIQIIKNSQLIIITFNSVQSESRSQRPGDTQYDQEVTTSLSPSITPAYLITVATCGTLPLGLDHIKSISVCCPRWSTSREEYSLFKF